MSTNYILMEERCRKMEYILGMNKRDTPKAFVDLENSMADIKANIA